MSRLIRNYQAGGQIVLSDHLRHYLADGGEAQIDDAELTRRLRHQAEAMVAEAAESLRQAQAKAAALLRNAQDEVIVLQAEAQARGYEEGYAIGVAEGRETGEQMLVAGIEEVQSLLSAIQTERAYLLSLAEMEVATLAMAIGEKVVGSLARQQKEMILHTVNRALNEVIITGPFSLRVHPDDVVYLEESWHQVESGDEGHSWKLVGDPAIQPGGCMLTCGPATVDARLSSQLKSIVNGLALTDYRLDGEEDEDSQPTPSV
ncbi:MAG TPA: FliH/SctL family protein, partial [Caldilineaceae bacterium]|nr:FliH/SctL family protein [Caldilineaceae bacterium]